MSAAAAPQCTLPIAWPEPMIDTSFVPAEIDCADWSQVEPLLKRLVERPLNTAAELETWLRDRSELDAAVSQAMAEAYIAMTCRTDDEAAKVRYLHMVENIEPKFKPYTFALNKKFVESPARPQLDPKRYEVLSRDLKREVELFREENVPIETDLAKLDQQYQEICGAMTVEFDGATRTMPQMTRYLEVTDRATREAAWRAMWERRLKDADHIEAIFDEMIEKRHRLALNAGYRNFRDFQHDRLKRFDYTP